MLGEILCWILAIGLYFSKTEGGSKDIVVLLVALGFIFVGAIYRAIDVHREVYLSETKEK